MKWFTVSFLKQLLFRKPAFFNQQDSSFTLPSFFVELLYLLVAQQHLEDPAFTNMLLSLSQTFAYSSPSHLAELPAYQNQPAETLLEQWKHQDFSCFNVSQDNLATSYSQLVGQLTIQQDEIQAEFLFCEYCFSLPFYLHSLQDTSSILPTIFTVFFLFSYSIYSF